MKKYISYCIPLLFFFTACDSFLEYKDNDKVIPSELSHYNELILGELLIANTSGIGYDLEIMSDDVEDYTATTTGSITDDRKSKAAYYIWAKEPQIAEDGTENDNKAWEWYYNKILTCNIIEDEVGKLEETLEGTKSRLLGEVQMMRALSYFYLVNMYGTPYESADQAKTAFGVPENKETGIYDKTYTRKTLVENYELMERDLKSAIDNLTKGENKNTIFRPNVGGAKLLLSRVYLFQHKYQEVINLCNELLGETHASIQSLSAMKEYTDLSKKCFLMKSNPGILFSWSTRDAIPFDSYSQGRFRTSADLMSKFVNDTRLKVWFDPSTWGNKSTKKYYYTSDCYERNLRVEEAYLNRAEAYLKLGKVQLGLDDINSIRGNRIDDANYKVVTTDPDKAWNAYQLERRLEFCFEEFRWFDIRRWGLEITHKYHSISDPASYKEYVLRKGSPNYILPLPLDIQRRNDKIEEVSRNEAEVIGSNN